jgi:ABC-type dipeptide/oligopeptide/nickel transport system permease component
MLRYTVRRLLFLVPSALIVAALVFGLFQLVPGDPILLMAGPTASEETIAALRAAHGLDKPLLAQFWLYLGRLVRGDLGASIFNGVPVADLIVPAFINTAILSAVSLAIGAGLSIVLGVVSAVKRGRLTDKLVTGASLLGISSPVFIVGLVLLYVFSVRLGILPSGGKGSWYSYVLPVTCLAIYDVSLFTRMVRTSVIDALSEDYIRTARSKGLREGLVVVRHGLRNALLPIVTIMGLEFGYTLGGSVVTETIFTWPGMGRLMVKSILTRDLPVTQGTLLLFAFSVVVVNLSVDLLYGRIDPKVRY